MVKKVCTKPFPLYDAIAYLVGDTGTSPTGFPEGASELPHALLHAIPLRSTSQSKTLHTTSQKRRPALR